MDTSGPSFWEFVIPPLLGCIGVHSIYKAYVIGLHRNEIKKAPFLADDENLRAFLSRKESESDSSFVGFTAKLIPVDSKSKSVICTRYRLSELDGIFWTLKHETPTSIELDHLLVERSYGRSIAKLGRTVKDVIRIPSPELAFGFESLFTEKVKTDMTKRSAGFDVNFDILRLTEEVILAGTTATIFGQLDVDGSYITVRAPWSWYKPFVITIKNKSDLLEEMQDAIIQHRRLAVYILGAMLFYYSWKKIFTWTIKRFTERISHRTTSYQSVDYDSNATCVVCLENPRDVLLVDCGHAAVCNDCSRLLEQCPLCRASIHTNPCRIFIT